MPFSTAHVNLNQVVGSLRSIHTGAQSQSNLPAWPFITISRQAGAGGRPFGKTLAEMLNERDHPAHQWQWLDRQLIARIAADEHVSQELIHSLERSSHTWISEFFSGLSLADHQATDLAAFRRVMETMRGLARAGHVILVGYGGVFITEGIPGGLHLRIVAPFKWRVANIARMDNLTLAEARNRVQLLDRDRDAFLHKFWPGKPVNQEHFHLTLNAQLLSEEAMAQAVAALVPRTTEGVIGVPWQGTGLQHAR